MNLRCFPAIILATILFGLGHPASADDRRIIISTWYAESKPCNARTTATVSVCDEGSIWLDHAPVGSLPCEDLEQITPTKTTETAKIFDWAALTPALQKGIRDSYRPPIPDPPDVSFALSYFRMCKNQRLGVESIPRIPAWADAPAKAEAAPIMDPATIPRELVFQTSAAPKGKRGPAGANPVPAVPVSGPRILLMP